MNLLPSRPPFVALGCFHSSGSIPENIRGGTVDELMRHVEQMNQDVNRALQVAPGSGQSSFGAQLTQAVERRLGRAQAGATDEGGDESSFAKKLTEAAEEKSGRKQHEEQVERERERYPEPRQRGKGE